MTHSGLLVFFFFFVQTTEQGCRDITEACKRNGIILSVCHVLRHFPPMRKIKELIDSGAVGDVVNIQHIEQVRLSLQS